MSKPGNTVSLEEQIDQWRSYLLRRQAIHSVDVAELEDHLREQIAGLIDSGLASDEAFLVAVKRMGALDALSREFAREHSDRLWKQLVVAAPESGEAKQVRSDAVVAFALAVAAAVLIKAPELFGMHLGENDGFYARNLSLFVLPLLTGYFVWKRARRHNAPLAGRCVCRGVCRSQRISLRNGQPHRGAVSDSSADRTVGRCGRRVCRTPLE